MSKFLWRMKVKWWVFTVLNIFRSFHQVSLYFKHSFTLHENLKMKMAVRELQGTKEPEFTTT